jgi:hypothetical protein
MNVTIAVDDEVLERAREVARRRGMSFQQLVREYLESVTGAQSGAEVAQQLLTLMDETPGRSGGRTIRRDEAYEGRL